MKWDSNVQTHAFQGARVIVCYLRAAFLSTQSDVQQDKQNIKKAR